MWTLLIAFIVGKAVVTGFKENIFNEKHIELSEEEVLKKMEEWLQLQDDPKAKRSPNDFKYCNFSIKSIGAEEFWKITLVDVAEVGRKEMLKVSFILTKVLAIKGQNIS